MFFGWKMAYDRHRATERQLETATRSLDGARRSAYNDRQLLLEFRSQSQRLQDEMAEDVERLQDRSNLIVLKRQAYDDKEKYDLSMQTSEAKRRELERKLGASCLEEMCLKKALSDAHAESEMLSTMAADMHNKYQAAASGEGLLKSAIVDHQRRITVLTRAVEGLKLSHKDEVDHLQL